MVLDPEEGRLPVVEGDEQTRPIRREEATQVMCCYSPILGSMQAFACRTSPASTCRPRAPFTAVVLFFLKRSCCFI